MFTAERSLDDEVIMDETATIVRAVNERRTLHGAEYSREKVGRQEVFLRDGSVSVARGCISDLTRLPALDPARDNVP